MLVINDIPQPAPGWSPSCQCDGPSWPQSNEQQMNNLALIMIQFL